MEVICPSTFKYGAADPYMFVQGLATAVNFASPCALSMSVTSSEQRRRQPAYRPFAISVVRNRDDVTVVAVGELDLVSADRLGAEVTDVWLAGPAEIVLDLSQVDFIDSTGLRVLLGHVPRVGVGAGRTEPR